MSSMLDQALEYLEWDWPIIPIIPETKMPAVKWKAYQDALPTENDVQTWWGQWPNAHVALVTGNLSGVVVVDCDSDEAIEFCRDNGVWSPVRVRTPRGGMHLYFRHPQDGNWRGPRVGSNSKGIDWPKFPTLDFRGDGSYPVLPPSKGYRWEVDPGHDMADMPMWLGWPMEKLAPPEPVGLFSLDNLSLENNRVVGDASVTEWDDTAALAAAIYPATGKLPTDGGNGRNMRVTRYTAQMIVRGHWGEELRERVLEYMDTFFEERLENWEGVIESVEASERSNHPERFDEEGNYKPPVLAVEEVPTEQVEEPAEQVEEPNEPFQYIRMEDADGLLAQAGNTRYLIEPWLQAGSIIQVAGFSGHGKSTFIGHLLAAAATGNPGDDIGPFVLGKRCKTLYLNYEEGRGTIARRLKQFESAHGDTGDNFLVWAPFINQDDMPLNNQDSLKKLGKMIMEVRPDVVVIDTIRSAWPGLKENEADAWTPFNLLVSRLRARGIAVIALQHRNKGDAVNGVGREAGSSNQLTMLENQLFIDMVVESKEEAKTRACICDQDYEMPVWPKLADMLNADEHLNLVLQVGYGKSRERDSALYQPRQWVGVAEDLRRGTHRFIGSSSPRTRARALWTSGGQNEISIARTLGVPLDIVNEWVRPTAP